MEDLNNNYHNHAITEEQMSFVENESHCPLCGTQLDISVESYLENHTLKEEAFCSHCQIKARVKDHKMQ